MTLKLGLLICDTPIPQVRERYGTYHEIFNEWLRRSLHLISPTATFTLDAFDVVQGQYPSDDDIHGQDPYKGFIITGSASNAFDILPWIETLVDFVAKLMSDAPNTKLIGICFGHQIIARAAGVQVSRNELGWEAGTTQIQLTDEGKRVFRLESGQMDIIEMHRDHVTEIPQDFTLLASNKVSYNQGMVKRYPSSHSNAGQIHVLTVQGHPEFSPDIVNLVVDARERSGAMDAETVAKAREKANKRDDGVGPIGRAVFEVFGLTE